MKSLARTALVLAILFVPAFASAQMYVQNQTTGYTTGFISISGNTFGYGIGNCTGNIACVADTVLFIINAVLVPVLFAVAFIVFLYGIARAYIFTMGDEAGRERGHQLMLWGLIGFVVMISIWGLVNVVANTFGLQGAFAPPTPSSISPYGSAVQSGGSRYIEQPRSTPQGCEAIGGIWDINNDTCSS